MVIPINKPNPHDLMSDRGLYDYLCRLADKLNMALVNIDVDNVAGTLQKAVKSADNVLEIGNTRIIYGRLTNGTSVAFPFAYSERPQVVTTPSANISVTTGGFTVASASTLDYIVIGRKENQ